ncbi:hypothetical protein HK097_005219, partial [Rhizophlyctis rosea]
GAEPSTASTSLDGDGDNDGGDGNGDGEEDTSGKGKKPVCEPPKMPGEKKGGQSTRGRPRIGKSGGSGLGTKACLDGEHRIPVLVAPAWVQNSGEKELLRLWEPDNVRMGLEVKL